MIYSSGDEMQLAKSASFTLGPTCRQRSVLLYPMSASWSHFTFHLVVLSIGDVVVYSVHVVVSLVEHTSPLFNQWTL